MLGLQWTRYCAVIRNRTLGCQASSYFVDGFEELVFKIQVRLRYAGAPDKLASCIRSARIITKALDDSDAALAFGIAE